MIPKWKKLFFVIIITMSIWFINGVFVYELGYTTQKNPIESESSDSIQPVIDALSMATPRYLPVVFQSHDAHAKTYGIHCQECHHDIQSADETPDACSSCHNQTDDDNLSLMNIMHHNCRNCHFAKKQSNPAAKAPIQCLECHQERK